jgi:hypothetical protein
MELLSDFWMINRIIIKSEFASSTHHGTSHPFNLSTRLVFSQQDNFINLAKQGYQAYQNTQGQGQGQGQGQNQGQGQGQGGYHREFHLHKIDCP